MFFLSSSTFRRLELAGVPTIGTRRCSNVWNSSDQEVKSVYSTRVMLQEVEILPILVNFYPLGYCFGLILGPCCAMFMIWDGFVADLKGCFQDEIGLKHCV